MKIMLCDMSFLNKYYFLKKTYDLFQFKIVIPVLMFGSAEKLDCEYLYCS